MFRTIITFTTFIIIIASIPITSVSSAYVVSDYDGCSNCLVTDDMTGDEWLSPIYTAGITYKNVYCGWNNLTTTEGFTIATEAQVIDLFTTFDVAPTNAWVPTANGDPNYFFSIFSPLREYGGYLRYRSLSGFIESSSTTKAYLGHMDQDRRGTEDGFPYGYYLSYVALDPYSFYKDTAYADLGTWLVRNPTTTYPSIPDNGIDCQNAITLLSFTQQGNILVWRTGTEINNVGFHVWVGQIIKGQCGKADAEYAQIRRLTHNLIPTQGDSLEEKSYSYKVPSLKGETSFCYGLEDIDASGISTYHIISATKNQ